ncbi:MAG TPA: Ig-like domain-containing protein [Chitinophagaceae bacterium]|jgi:hypothetical protein|nr:Ig-like domain-containing protein [Chitinophagaceae bacterium]
MKKLFIPLLAILVVSSCSKENVDDQRPVITITSPQNGQVFTTGQTVTVVANVSENDEIHGVHLHVINLKNGDHTIMFEDHPDAKTYTLNKTFVVQAGVDYDITVEADDHSGNSAIAKVQVTGR